MTVQKVLEIPHLCLSNPTTEITDFGSEEIQLANDLIDTMLASPGCVGLAANQIGVPRRIFALDVSGHHKTTSCHGQLVICNPVLIDGSDNVTLREGCMSVPHFTGDITRPSKICLKGYDPQGAPMEIITEGFEARAILHELDHLNGYVFIDRIESPTALFKRKVYL